MRIRIITYIIALSLSGVARAQVPDYTPIDGHASKVPLGASLSVKKLSNYLTSPYDDDEAKVRAIFHWVRSHISYNVRAYARNKRKRIPPGRLLIRRKAVCLGYAELFKALCEASGIKTEVVVGYDKGSNYEPGDHFIRDDHAWNVVQVNGTWRLVDPTWSAGYISDRRKGLIPRLLITLGVELPPRSHFEKAPVDLYFLTDPKVFAEDHLPSICEWQLLNPPVPMRAWEHDSLSFFFATPNAFPPATCEPNDSLLRLADHRKGAIIPALQAHAFNPFNNRVMAEGLYKHATELGRDAAGVMEDVSGADPIATYDTAIVRLKLAKQYYMSYRTDCREELKSYRDKNRDLFKSSNELLNEQIRLDKGLMRALSRHIANLDRGGEQHRKMRDALAAENKAVRKLRLDQTRHNRKEPTPDQLAERDQLLQSIYLNHDTASSIVREDSTLIRVKIPELYTFMQRDRNQLDKDRDHIVALIEARTDLRKHFSFQREDELKALSDSLSYLKLYGAYLSNNVREQLYASILNQKERIKEDGKATRELLKTNLDIVRNLKKLSQYDMGEDQLYKEQLGKLMAENEQQVTYHNQQISDMRSERISASIERKRLYSEIRLLEKERTEERRRFGRFNTLYNNRHANEYSVTTAAMQAIGKLSGIYRDRISKIRQAQRKEEARERKRK
ncbi:MAG: hypothetical protein H6585_03135 [Flavobacteriales bacterium]|nr:hypothetical protein [Flavobacteriales bacterium]MCB9447322.1 hypothetical protein [Flavobacteriales bacterium]